MSDHLDKVRKLVSEAITELENWTDALEGEQRDSENEHDEWEETKGEELELEEPDVLDYSEEIGKISRAVNFLEKVVDELAED